MFFRFLKNHDLAKRGVYLEKSKQKRRIWFFCEKFSLKAVFGKTENAVYHFVAFGENKWYNI